MTKKQIVKNPMDAIPSEIREIFGPPPLLDYENKNLYYTLIDYFARTVSFKNIIVWLMLKDLADLRLEIHLYRRLRASLRKPPRLSPQVPLSLIRLNRNSVSRDIRERLEAEGIKMDSKTDDFERRAISAIRELQKRGDMDEKLDQTLAFLAMNKFYLGTTPNLETALTIDDDDDDSDNLLSNIETYHRLDALLETAQRRYRTVLRDLDEYSYGFSQILRESVGDIIEAEVIDPARKSPRARVGRRDPGRGKRHSAPTDARGKRQPAQEPHPRRKSVKLAS